MPQDKPDPGLDEVRDGPERPPHPDSQSPDSPSLAQAFASLAENARSCGVFLLDPAGRISYWGDSARRLHGWSVDEIRGAHLSRLYPEDGSEDGTAEGHLADARTHGEHTGEGHRLRKDGTAFWAHAVLTDLRGDDDALVGFAVVEGDLSARRAAEAELARSIQSAEEVRRQAEEANQAKTNFLTVMSHEIRTPLNGMLGYLDLLEGEVGGPITPEQRDYILRARRSGKHVVSLVEEILDLTLIESGKVRIDRKAGRLAEVVDSAIALVEPQARERGLTVENTVSEDGNGLLYWGHEDRVRQILVNLLSNAVKFTESGGRITISAGVVEQRPPAAHLPGDGPWLWVRIRDTGEGIEPERLEMIFEPYVREDRHRRIDPKGIGLGLDISRRLARLMDGDLTARSNPGEGSTFSLWLEAAPGQRGPEPEDAEGVGGEAASWIPATSFRRAGQAILMELERVLNSFVGRIRLDPQIPTDGVRDQAVLEDHIATFLADLAQSLVAMDPSSDLDSGDVETSSEIQQVVAKRHGKQRAGLGWSEPELRREYALLREELEAAVQRRTPPGVGTAQGVQEALQRFLDQAERASLQSFRATRQPEPSS